MSGEFGVRLRDVMNLPYSTAKETCFLNYFLDEILSLYEAAEKNAYRQAGTLVQTSEDYDICCALDDLDAKAKEKL